MATNNERQAAAFEVADLVRGIEHQKHEFEMTDEEFANYTLGMKIIADYSNDTGDRSVINGAAFSIIGPRSAE